MIKSIEIKNIQSHEETRLDFNSGINCIVGSSNNGKSAILRALYWVRYNRPLGIDTLASHWALDKKGNLKDEMSVTITNENGKVTRRRTKSENQYFVNNKELNVVKSDVPEEVFQALSLSDTNIQRQLDEPFLLSQTSGEVAKYFNKIVRLDIIDKVLTNAESQRRKTKAEIENTEKQIKAQEDKKDSYSWLPDVEKLLTKYEKVSNKNKLLKDQLYKLKLSLQNYEECIEKVDKYSIIAGQKTLLDKLTRVSEKTAKINDKRGYIKDSLDAYEELSERSFKDFSKEKKLLKELSELIDINGKQDYLIKSLLNKMDIVEGYEEIIQDKKETIADLKKQLPKVCPVCGQPWDCCKEI